MSDIRFWSKVTKGPDCWIWNGATDWAGYGHCKVGKKLTGAHRRSWELLVGPVPDGMKVLHKCDVRNCVNPDHLWIGTHSDNMRDMVSKGRHGLQVLDNDVLLSIAEGRASGKTMAAIARELGISLSTAYRGLRCL